MHPLPNYAEEMTAVIVEKMGGGSKESSLIPKERRLFYEHAPVYLNHTSPRYFAHSLLGHCQDAPWTKKEAGHRPWFSVLMDADGCNYTAYYREPRNGNKDASFFVIGISGQDFVTKGRWRHGDFGLTHVVMQAIISDFNNLFWFEN